jgi:hypothetical protein
MMVKGYRYDIFVSYRHDLAERSRMTSWIRKVLDILEYWLKQELGGQPVALFFDKDEIEIGNRWPNKLKEALLSSRCLLPFWSPGYFHSEWCCIELGSFLAREKMVQESGNLILPITFHDGEDWFPDEVNNITQLYLHKYAKTNEAFWATSDADELEGQLKDFAWRLARAVEQAPPFQDWPIERSRFSMPQQSRTEMRRLRRL